MIFDKDEVKEEVFFLFKSQKLTTLIYIIYFSLRYDQIWRFIGLWATF